MTGIIYRPHSSDNLSDIAMGLIGKLGLDSLKDVKDMQAYSVVPEDSRYKVKFRIKAAYTDQFGLRIYQKESNLANFDPEIILDGIKKFGFLKNN